jgi:hypothetical protein
MRNGTRCRPNFNGSFGKKVGRIGRSGAPAFDLGTSSSFDLGIGLFPAALSLIALRSWHWIDTRLPSLTASAVRKSLTHTIDVQSNPRLFLKSSRDGALDLSHRIGQIKTL